MKRTSPPCDLPTDSLQTTDPKILSILDAYLERLEDGEDPNVDELIAGNPELAGSLPTRPARRYRASRLAKSLS